MYIRYRSRQHRAEGTVGQETRFLHLVSQIFKCQPDSGYFDWANKPENRWVVRIHNFQLWNICKNLSISDAECIVPELYRKVCSISQVRLIKTVRLRVRATEKLLNDPVLGKTVKIVVLVRDPRGVMHSRAEFPSCAFPYCSDVTTVCRDLASDIIATSQIKKTHPDRIHLIRYEDLSIDPFGTSDELFKFLGLPQYRLVDTFIEEHTRTLRSRSLPTNGDKITTDTAQEKAMQERSGANYHSTTRNSKATVFLWKKNMRNEDISNVQRVCKNSMKMLGYNPMTNIDQNRVDDSFALIVKSPQQL